MIGLNVPIIPWEGIGGIKLYSYILENNASDNYESKFPKSL